MMTGSYRYGDEDKILAWLHDLDREENLMSFRRTVVGQEMDSDRVRRAMRTLVGFGLARCPRLQRPRDGCAPWTAEITGEGIVVVREHSGRVAEWRMVGTPHQSGSLQGMNIPLVRGFVLWLKEKGDIDPEEFLADAQQWAGQPVSKEDLTDLVADLVDDEIVHGDRNAFGIEEDALPLRVRLTSLGRQVVRRHDGRVDLWQDSRATATSPGSVNIAGSVYGSQIGMSGRDLTQTQNASSGLSEDAAGLLRQVLDQLEGFELDEDDQDDLEDAANAGLRALDAPDEDGNLPQPARRRLSKVGELLGRVGTGAAGSVAANQILEGIHHLL